MRYSKASVVGSIRTWIEYTDNKANVSIWRNGAVQISWIFSVAPFPFRQEPYLDLRGQESNGLIQNLSEQFVVSLHTSVDFLGIVISHSLLASACYCIVMLVYSHYIEHLVLLISHVWLSCWSSRLLNHFQSIEFVGSVEVVRGSSNVFLVSRSTCEVSCPVRSCVVCIWEHIVVFSRPLDVLRSDGIEILTRSTVY